MPNTTQYTVYSDTFGFSFVFKNVLLSNSIIILCKFITETKTLILKIQYILEDLLQKAGICRVRKGQRFTLFLITYIKDTILKAKWPYGVITASFGLIKDVLERMYLTLSPSLIVAIDGKLPNWSKGYFQEDCLIGLGCVGTQIAPYPNRFHWSDLGRGKIKYLPKSLHWSDLGRLPNQIAPMEQFGQEACLS